MKLINWKNQTFDLAVNCDTSINIDTQQIDESKVGENFLVIGSYALTTDSNSGRSGSKNFP